MRTAIEMDQYCLSKGFTNSNKSKLKHFQVIEKYLMPDEDVLEAMAPNNLYNGDFLVMSGVCAVAFTNRRFICGQNGFIIGDPVKIFDLEQVSDVYMAPGRFDGVIKIFTNKENFGFTFKKEKLENAFNTVLSVISWYRNQPQPLSNDVEQVSDTDELIKFKELLDMGVITQEEFDLKKREILGF